MQANGVMPGEEDWTLGCIVTVRTVLGEDITGTIFTFDPLTNMLVISEEGSQPWLLSYRFLKADFIREIVFAEPPSVMTRNALEYLRLEDCIRREEESIRAIEVQRAPGVEVIEAGQKLFSKLSEEYSCKWEGLTINVEDKVLIDAPYTIADFRSSDEHDDLKEMLKLSVDEES